MRLPFPPFLCLLTPRSSFTFKVRKWNAIINLGLWLSIAGFFIIQMILDSAGTKSEVGWDFVGLGKNMFKQPTYWLTLVLTIIFALLPRFTVMSYKVLFTPSPNDVVRELEVHKCDPKNNGRDAEAASKEKYDVEMVTRTTSG